MATSISRRTVLAAGAGAAVGLSLPGAVVHAGGSSATNVRFRLDAQVLDGGEQVTSVTLDTARLGPIDPGSLTTGTFTVHARATSPIALTSDDPIYDLDRPVTAVRLDHDNIVLDLSHGEGQVGGGTLGYLSSKGSNVRLNLVYTITQHAPVITRTGRPITISGFLQDRLSSPEVDAFGYGISGSGMKYRLYSPDDGGSPRTGQGPHPLVVWLHGGGEGALLADNYYDNETTLRANRGALGFATPEARRIFNGAYVVAPQSTSYWMEDGPRFAPLIYEIIRDVVREHPVDRARIYVAGCSNGGYMSLKMTTVYPELFAASVPICGVVTPLRPDGPPLVSAAELAAVTTPTWLVASLDDTTVSPAANTVHAHDLIGGSLVTLYEHVIWNGYQFPGHWSWIYVARNDPSMNGTHIWQWMAQQRR